MEAREAAEEAAAARDAAALRALAAEAAAGVAAREAEVGAALGRGTEAEAAAAVQRLVYAVRLQEAVAQYAHELGAEG